MKRYAIFYGFVLTTATLLAPDPGFAFPISPSSLLPAVDSTNLLVDVRSGGRGGGRAGGAPTSTVTRVQTGTSTATQM